MEYPLTDYLVVTSDLGFVSSLNVMKMVQVLQITVYENSLLILPAMTTCVNTKENDAGV